MINAKLPYNTKSLKIDGKRYCVYCGQEIKPDTEIDHHETTEYFHCDCEDALKEIKIYQEIKKLQLENQNIVRKIYKLEEQYPKPLFKLVKTIMPINESE